MLYSIEVLLDKAGKIRKVALIRVAAGGRWAIGYIIRVSLTHHDGLE